MKRSLKIDFAIAVTITILAMGQPLYAQNPRPTQVPNRKALSAPKPVEPCCAVAAVDSSTGVVTAKENATGKIFQFKVAHSALLNSLKVGKGIYANFGAQQVSLNGSVACCKILWVSLTPSAAVCAKVGWGFKDNACYRIPNSGPPRHYEEGGGSSGSARDRCTNRCQKGAADVGGEFWYSGVGSDGTCTCGIIMHTLFGDLYIETPIPAGDFSTAGGQASGPQSVPGVPIRLGPGSSTSGGMQKETYVKTMDLSKEKGVCTASLIVGNKECTLTGATSNGNEMKCSYDCGTSNK